MDRLRMRLALTAGVAGASLCACLAACSSKADREPMPDWSSDAATGGVGEAGVDAGADSDASGDAATIPPSTFGIVVPSTVAYPNRLRILGTKDQPCATMITDGGAGPTGGEVECVLDMDELDLHVQGYALDIITPLGACDYVLYKPYIYAAWPSGTGPSTVSYTVQGDGTYSDEVNSQNGTPACPYDYRSTYVGGPNCCDGSYTLTITSADTGKTTTKVATWGGVDSDCYDGAAFWLEGGPFDSKGFPIDPIWFIDREMQRIHIKHAGISDKYTRGAGLSVPLASFWNEIPGRTTPPIALTEGLARANTRIECLDNAHEVLAVIRLHVREWNEKVQLASDGEPNTTGTEATFGGPIDDYFDWADLAKQGQDYTRALRSTK